MPLLTINTPSEDSNTSSKESNSRPKPDSTDPWVQTEQGGTFLRRILPILLIFLILIFIAYLFRHHLSR